MRINLGSGQRPFKRPAWTNVDCEERWKPDILTSGDRLPMDDGTVEMVVAHHVMEHVGLGEFDGTIRECHRVLQPGGSLIVTTPDLDALARAYVRGVTPQGRPFDTYLFCVNLFGAYMDREADRHRWAYTSASLAGSIHKAAVWQRVRSFDWRFIEGADIAVDWWILGVEAVK